MLGYREVKIWYTTPGQENHLPSSSAYVMYLWYTRLVVTFLAHKPKLYQIVPFHDPLGDQLRTRLPGTRQLINQRPRSQEVFVSDLGVG